MDKFVINGKIFKRKNITGLQRYVIEILKELDKIVQDMDIEILVPKKSYFLPDLKNIRIKKMSNLQENLWEQIILPLYAIMHKRKILNLANSAPIIKPDICIIHDIVAVKRKEFFKKSKHIYTSCLFQFIVKKSEKIITVSEFSRKEIAEYYQIDKEKIEIIYNGWQHIEHIKEDDNIVNKIRKEVGGKKYFFSVGTLTKHKNLKWVIKVAKNNPQYIFLISGFQNSKKIYRELGIENTKNVRYLGYLTDEEMKGIIKNAEGLLFPSYYEGFGIPPLEALALGTKAIVSDIPVLKEIYGDSVYYINPNDTTVNLEKLIEKEISKDKVTAVLEKYSWKSSAEKLNTIIIRRERD